MKIIKTVVIQLKPDEQDAQKLEHRAEESARWMNRVFRRLYADKRNHGWVDYGPDKDWGKKYGSIVRWKPLKRIWHVVGETLYPAFIRKDAPNRIDSSLPPASLQLLSQKVAVIWGNFIDNSGKVPRPKGHLPEMPRLAIYNVKSDAVTFEDTGFEIKMKDFTIKSAESKKIRYKDRINLIKTGIANKTWSAVEIKKHLDGKWYAHIPIQIDSPEVVKQPHIVMGVDMGIRNVMTAAVVQDVVSVPQSMRIPGAHLFQRLEHIKNRIGRLRSLKDRGNTKVRKAIRRLKGKRSRMQQTLVRQTAVRLIKQGLAVGVEGIAVEDLRNIRFPKASKKINRMVTNWARGEARDFISSKSAEHGLNITEVPHAGTSTKCPSCGHIEEKNRVGQNFKCRNVACRFSANADDVASVNIARLGWKYWNSSKWDNNSDISQSTRPLLGTGVRTADRIIEGSRTSQVANSSPPKHTNGGRTAPTEAPEKSEMPTIGPSAEDLSAEARYEPSRGQKPMRQVDKPCRASDKVARGAPRGARTVNETAGNSHIDSVTAPGNDLPLGNSTRPLSVSESLPSQRLANP